MNLTVTSEQDAETIVLRFVGHLVTDQLHVAEAAVNTLKASVDALRIDLAAVSRLDTGGAWLVSDIVRQVEGRGGTATLIGTTEQQDALFHTVNEAWPEERGSETPPGGFLVWVEGLGASIVQSRAPVESLLNFIGASIYALGQIILRPRRLRGSALFSQMQEVGFNAVPIVVLMSFLIGVVLAFQGAAQLRQFGAEVFVVDLISVSILRELGVLLTAIIVAGRSGSAFTATIGSMKVREELDAIRTMGLDPIAILVVPRVLALVIMLPILGFIANLSGLFGGALMSWIELGVSPAMFVTRLYENTDVWHLIIGMIKAPFFAFVIAIIACWQASQVGGSSESVGQRTTASVVQSIFLVIVLDAIFSIFFVVLGV